MCYQAEHTMVYYCDDESCRLPLQETQMLFCCLVGTSSTGVERYRPVDPNTVYCPRGFTWDPEPAISSYRYDGPQPGLCPLHRLAAHTCAEAAAEEQEQEHERQQVEDAARAMVALQEQEHLEAQEREQEDVFSEEVQVDEELVEEPEVEPDPESQRRLDVAEQYEAILRESGRLEADHWLRWRQDMNF